MSSAKKRFRELYQQKLREKKQHSTGTKQQKGGGNIFTAGPNPLNVFPSNMMVNGHREPIAQRIHDYICIKRDSIKQIGSVLMDTLTT